MINRTDAQSIRNIGKEAEGRAQAAGKICLTVALVMGIPLIILMASHIINYQDSELMYILGLDDSPFLSFVIGITFAVIPSVVLLFLGRLITGICSHMACQSEMAAQAALLVLEKMERLEKGDSVQLNQATEKEATCRSASAMVGTYELSGTENQAYDGCDQHNVIMSQANKSASEKWFCRYCGKENSPWDNICNNCGKKKVD